MKRLLVSLLCLGLSSALVAIPIPPPLETAHLLGPRLAAGTPPRALEDELYPLGWSEDNLFAVLERRSGVSAAETLRMRVYDLVGDVVVFETFWRNWNSAEDPDTWWTLHEQEISLVFERFHLVPKQQQLGLFPLILDNEYYTTALRTNKNPLENQWIDRIDLLVRSTGRGMKSFLGVQGYWRWATLLGFLPSPFENRLAVISLVQPAGWLGSEQPLRFRISGLSLKAGFPKP